MQILDFVPPGWTLRPAQRGLLLAIEEHWDTTDVYSVLAPTAVGKTLLAYVIARWAAAKRLDANILQPTNVLVDQFLEKFPDLTVLKKQDAYRCVDFKRSCETTKNKCKKFCDGCPYVEARMDAARARIRLLNYHVYFAHRLYSPVMIADEGHQLVDMLSDIQNVRIWQFQYKFPDGLKLVSDVVTWIQRYLAEKDDDRLRRILRDIIRIRDGATVEYKKIWRLGRPQVVLQILPPVNQPVPPWLWPTKVKKVILLSATIGTNDIHDLGLSGRRVTYLGCDSPIDPANRPVIYEPLVNMSMKHRPRAIPKLAARILELLDKHPEKGLIHLPYSAAGLLREHLDHPRLMWHGRKDKSEVLAKFKNSPPSEGRVMVASGLYEGVDLPYDAARWQVIGCVPFGNLGDERIAMKQRANPDGYAWEAIKRVLQAAGRIVRTPDDFGTSYILDTNFGRLYEDDGRRAAPFFPKFFRRAVQIQKGTGK